MRHLARFVLAALLALPLGCSRLPATPTPTTPTTPTTASTKFWGMVIEQSGACIAGAKVNDQAQDTPCDVWGYSGGFLLTGLSSGVPITLRASAPGYVTKDVVVIPSASGPGYNTVFEIVLSRVE